jgi:hypothetical protein
MDVSAPTLVNVLQASALMANVLLIVLAQVKLSAVF